MRLASLSFRSACRASSRSSGLSSTSRISTALESICSSSNLSHSSFFDYRSVCGARVFQPFQGEIKRRTLVDFRIDPDAAAVLLDDALHRGQPYPGAFKVFGTMKPLEHAKKLIGILHAETHTVITNKYRAAPVVLTLAHLNDGALPRSGELDGVGEQVGEHLPD